MHAAQALNDVPTRYDPARLRRPTTPLPRRGCPIGLGVNLSVTEAVPATEMICGGAGRTSEGALHSRRHICDACYAGWLTVHARQHPREVCPLSRGAMLQPLSGPLTVGLRFLPRPVPAAPSARLAVRFPPEGRTTGLPRCAAETLRGLGPASTPVARHLRRGSSEAPDLATYLFGPSLILQPPRGGHD
jgi:hypothetical protein